MYFNRMQTSLIDPTAKEGLRDLIKLLPQPPQGSLFVDVMGAARRARKDACVKNVYKMVL